MRILSSKRLKILGWVACLPLILAASEANAVLPLPIAERSADEDFRSLIGDPAEDALKRFRGLYSIYLERVPPRLDLILEKASWISRNPTLPVYFEEQIRKYPVFVENADDRRALTETLNRFPAEWAVRLLVKLYLEDEPIRSEKYNLKDPEIVRRMALTWDTDIDNQTNRRFATNALGSMKLANWGGEALQQKPNEPWQEFENRVRTHRQNWIRSNQDRIPEIVKKTWGDKAVLNADLGLGPDNLPIKNRPPENQTGTQERPNSGTAANSSQAAPTIGRWNWIWIGATALLAFIGIVLWRRKLSS